MNIITKAKNLELTPAIENAVDEKVGKLAKFLPEGSGDIFVEVERETNHHKKGEIFSAEIIVHLAGKKLVAKADSDDLFKAILEAKDQMEIEIKKHKGKQIDANRRPAMKGSNTDSF